MLRKISKRMLEYIIKQTITKQTLSFDKNKLRYIYIYIKKYMYMKTSLRHCFVTFLTWAENDLKKYFPSCCISFLSPIWDFIVFTLQSILIYKTLPIQFISAIFYVVIKLPIVYTYFVSEEKETQATVLQTNWKGT